MRPKTQGHDGGPASGVIGEDKQFPQSTMGNYGGKENTGDMSNLTHGQY